MDFEVALTYRLTRHLAEDEVVLATLVSIQHGIYAATNRRILCLNDERIGYRLRVHPYESLDGVECVSEDGAWFVQFVSPAASLLVRARNERAARRFADAASRHCEKAHDAGVEHAS